MSRTNNPYISLCVNLDTRGERNQQEGLFAGCVNLDFLTSGVFNKCKFLNDFDYEVVVHIDEHHDVDEKTLFYLRSLCDVVIIRTHTQEEKFNDNNYIRALQACSGDIIMHMDGDEAAFTSSKESVQELIDLLEHYDYVSYPCKMSPNPDYNENYDYWWCSTRFFICKRETLDFTEIKKCLSDSDYLYGKYPASVRNPWLEHICGLHAKYLGKKKGVFYPPIDLDKLAIFTWESYEQYRLTMLNEMPYEEVKNWIISRGGIQYPNNVKA